MSKMKIYNMIPGRLINEEDIMNRISELIDSVEFDKWIELNENIYSLDFFVQNDEFYVMYLDPRGVVKKLYVTCCNELVAFMKVYIDYKYGSGVDIAVCTKEITNAVICNHDGQIFLLKM